MPKQESVQPFLQSLYGINQKESETFDRMCLLSRRRGERGVRFVQAGRVCEVFGTHNSWLGVGAFRRLHAPYANSRCMNSTLAAKARWDWVQSLIGVIVAQRPQRIAVG